MKVGRRSSSAWRRTEEVETTNDAEVGGVDIRVALRTMYAACEDLTFHRINLHFTQVAKTSRPVRGLIHTGRGN